MGRGKKSKQNELGKKAQDSLVFSKLRYCANHELFFNPQVVKSFQNLWFEKTIGISIIGELFLDLAIPIIENPLCTVKSQKQLNIVLKWEC